MRNTTAFNIPARYMDSRGIDYLHPNDLAWQVTQDIENIGSEQNTSVIPAFDFTVASIGYLAEMSPPSFNSALQFCRHRNTTFSHRAVARCLRLAASNPKYDWAPFHRVMAVAALANDHTRHDILSTIFRPLVNIIQGIDDRPYIYREPKYSSLKKNVPFVHSTKLLWRDAQAGRFTKAVQKLAPLVNMLVEQEADGIFPLGIGISGQNMSEERYKWTNSHTVWPINEAKKSVRNAICLAIGVHENLFISGTARLIAANMLAVMADPKAGMGIATYLPGDLQRLKICHEKVKKGLPLDNRYESQGYPNTASNYVERPRIWTPNQTMSPTPAEELSSPEMFILTPERIRHQRSLALLRQRALKQPKQPDDLVRSL